MMLSSDPVRDAQVSWLRMTTRSDPSCSSSATNVLPLSIGRTPSAANNAAETSAPTRRAAASDPVNVAEVASYSPIWLVVFDRLRQVCTC